MTRQYSNEQEPENQSLLLNTMTYWDEPDRRNVLIRLILLGAVGVTIAVHHLLPVIIGLAIAGFLYFRKHK